ncbi:MAG TPA: hypothetical protein VHB77_21380 [Planctomycetaceae bacterium]|nr:hypothetical protein [Planctomycetaceae bacterium]
MGQALSLDDWARLTGLFVVRLDVSGSIFEVSGNLVQLLGSSADRFVGRRLQDFEADANPVGRIEDWLHAAWDTGNRVERLIRLHDAQGRPWGIWFRAARSELATRSSDSELFLFGHEAGDLSSTQSDQIASLIHSLNNVMTALYCQWDMLARDTGLEADAKRTGAITQLLSDAGACARSLAQICGPSRKKTTAAPPRGKDSK